MEKSTVKHQRAVKQILRYLKGTMNLGLVYTQGGKEEEIVGYTDSDLAGDLVGRRSTTCMSLETYMTLRRVINDSQKGVEQVDWPRANLAQVTSLT